MRSQCVYGTVSSRVYQEILQINTKKKNPIYLLFFGAPTSDRTGDPLVYRVTLNQLSHTGPGKKSQFLNGGKIEQIHRLVSRERKIKTLVMQSPHACKDGHI